METETYPKSESYIFVLFFHPRPCRRLHLNIKKFQNTKWNFYLRYFVAPQRQRTCHLVLQWGTKTKKNVEMVNGKWKNGNVSGKCHLATPGSLEEDVEGSRA